MPAEYRVLRMNEEETDHGSAELLNAFAGEGWTVKAAYSPTHFLLERLPPVAVARAEPRPPTGTRL